MPALTRRRERPDRRHVYYLDVHVGAITRRVGNPASTDSWEWTCGFYPGSQPGEHQHGTAVTFDQARADFEGAWRIFLANRTETDFQAWREAQAFTAWKYRMWDTGHRLPTQTTTGRSTCFCGANLSIGSVPDRIRSAHLETA
jgi:hypothetical protein